MFIFERKKGDVTAVVIHDASLEVQTQLYCVCVRAMSKVEIDDCSSDETLNVGTHSQLEQK